MIVNIILIFGVSMAFIGLASPNFMLIRVLLDTHGYLILELGVHMDLLDVLA